MKIIINGQEAEVHGSAGIPVKPLTQAEYDALTEEEKQAEAVYMIPGPSGCIPAEGAYSTEETRIGTWIDGKTVYRKCMPIAMTARQVSITPPEHEKILNIRIVPDGDIEFFGNYYVSEQDACRQWYNKLTNLVYVDIAIEFNVSTAVLVLEYTKTTD